jgi:arylsulfatase A-like enzyme
MGMLLGLFEAGYLRRNSLPPGMLRPNVTAVIWLWGPLLDGAAGVFIGLGSGLLMAVCPWRRVWQSAVKVFRAHAVVILLAGFGAACVLLSYALAGNLYALRTLKVTAAILLPALANRIGRSVSLRTLGATLGSAFVLLLCGVGVYSLKPPLRASAASPAPDKLMTRPNVVLITLDTVRADHLSLYGYSRHTSPNLDKWGQQGVVFENAIAPTSWTLASHASMFTGTLPHQHGADWLIPLSTRRWTLADVLKSWGYETAGFTTNYVYGEAGWGMDEGFDLYEDDRESAPHTFQALKLAFGAFGPLYRRWLGSEYVERQYASQANRDIFAWLNKRSPRPFFLFINYFDAHDPYLAPKPYSHQFGDFSPDLARRTKYVFARSAANLPELDRTALIAGYDNCLASLDHAVGVLLNTLSRLPGWENTVVIITSDHGEGFGEHGAFSHGENLYREALHVPLIVLGPGTPKGVRVSSIVPTQELFSTILEFAGQGDPSFVRTGLQRYWTPRIDVTDSDEPVVSELTPKYPSAGLWPQISLRTAQWTYIRNSRGDEELYRWPRDPDERVNLAGSAEYRHVREELRARLRGLVSESLRPWQGPQYLSALNEPGHPFVNMASSADEFASGQSVTGLPIGEVQNRFPLKEAVSSGKLQTEDTDLLQSLPYH